MFIHAERGLSFIIKDDWFFVNIFLAQLDRLRVHIGIPQRNGITGDLRSVGTTAQGRFLGVLRLDFHHEVVSDARCFLVWVVGEQLAQHGHASLYEFLLHFDFLVDLHNFFHQLQDGQVFERNVRLLAEKVRVGAGALLRTRLGVVLLIF